jgi:hypothetical protein
MWTTDTKSVHEHDFDKVVEMTHDFGNGVTVVSNFETSTTTLMHGAIAVSEHDLIRDTEKYTNYLNNLNNEVNPLKN